MAKQKLSFFSRIVVVLNMLSVAGLLLSYLASYVSPERFWMLGLFGLAYPVLLLINLLFVGYWIISWRRWVFLSLAAISLGFPYLINTFQFGSSGEGIDKARLSLNILSYNVRLFDLYNWSGHKGTRGSMIRLMARNRPDIACIQEFYSESRKMNNVDSLKKSLRLKNFHVEYTESLLNGNWGMATFSKYPIVNRGKIDFKSGINNLCIFSDIAIGKDTVRVYNVHFQSIRFQPEDYEFVKKLSDNEADQKEGLQGSRKILKRLKIAFIKRVRQVNAVKESIRSSPYPVIVCGDFNDTPSSFTYHQLRSDLRDAFVESGSGIGNTYNGIFPSFRIDYILHDPKFSSHSFRTIRRDLSDHFPVTCTLSVNP
jgi:endonuclease/exonuclease/phosphatase family metal-dependent hydrolase